MKKVHKVALAAGLALVTSAMLIGCGNSTPSDSNPTSQGPGNTAGRRGMPAQKTPEEMKTLLAPLVKAGTINQQQADKVVTYLQQRETARKNMTQAEREAERTKNQGERKAPLADLVANKTLTQQQADQAAKVLFPGRGPGEPKATNS